MKRRYFAIAALLLLTAITLPRVLTHSPMRLGVALDTWWSGNPPVVERVVGPPSKGRLEVGDRLLELNGQSLTDPAVLKGFQANGLPSDEIELTVERNGERLSVVLPRVELGVWERLRLVIFPITALLAAPLVAFLLVWRRPDLGVAWTFLWFACMQGAGALWGIFQHPMVESTGAFKAYLTGYTALVWWYPAAFLHFMTVFPRPRWTSETRNRSPWFWFVGLAYAAPIVMWSMFPSGPPPHYFGIYQGIVFPLAVLSLFQRYIRPSGENWAPRRYERVLAVFIGVSLLLAATFGAVADSPAALAMFPPTLLKILFSVLSITWVLSPLVIAYLIANDPVFDPRRVLVQSIPYALLSGVLAALYLGVVLVSQRLFATATGETAMVFNVVAALIVAFLFAPLRERLQRWLDRLFGRDPRVLREALDAAGHHLLSAADRDEVKAAVQEGLSRGLKRKVRIEWVESGAPELADADLVPADARAGVENLLAQAGIRLESLALQEARAAAERRAVEMREAAARAELRALHAQVQPHFLFNALNALSYLTETDPAAAQRFTERLADMLRYTVEASNRRAALLSEEIEFVEDYLGVARERYENTLSFEYRGTKELLSLAVPPLLLQPLVENSLKHGCSPGADALHLRLEAVNDGGWLTLVFSDNGVANGNGASPPGLGVGLENLEQRVRRFAGPEAEMEAGPQSDGGYRVRLRWRILQKVA